METTWDMSDEQIREWEKVLEKLVKSVWALLVGAFLMGGWVAVIQFQTVEHSQSIVAAKSDLNSLALWRAETQASRFTTQDYIRSTAPIQDSVNGLDKRTQRLEDALAAINKSMERIENAVVTKRNP